jgi:hypothetical protein
MKKKHPAKQFLRAGIKPGLVAVKKNLRPDSYSGAVEARWCFGVLYSETAEISFEEPLWWLVENFILESEVVNRPLHQDQRTSVSTVFGRKRRIGMGNTVYEFMTHWDSPRRIWFKRDEEELIGTQRVAEAMPRIRVFDLSNGPTNHTGFKPAILWKGKTASSKRIAPTAPSLTSTVRSDYDVLVFQFRTSLAETEFGDTLFFLASRYMFPREWPIA